MNLILPEKSFVRADINSDEPPRLTGPRVGLCWKEVQEAVAKFLAISFIFEQPEKIPPHIKTLLNLVISYI